MSKRPPRHSPDLSSPPWWFLPFLFLTAFGVYTLTLNPALFRNDSPETITACFALGVSHPPGYPLHTLLGRLFALNQIGNPAMTLNFFSAFLGSLGVCLFALNLWTLLKTPFPEPKTNKDIGRFFLTAVCLIGGLCFAFSKSYWSVSLAAKGGIYNFQVVLELGFLFYFQLWVQSLQKKAGLTVMKNSYFLVFIFVLGLTNHWPTQLLLTWALVITGLAYRRSTYFRLFQNLRWKHISTALTVSILVLSLYLYLPLRAHLNPALNFGNPSTFRGFVFSLTRAKYFKTETISFFLPTALSTIQGKGNYLSDRFETEFSILFSFLAIPGFLVLWRQKLKKELLFLLALLLTTLLANLFYLQVLPIEYWHMDDHLMTLNWVTALLCSAGLFFPFKTFRLKGLAKYLWCLLLALLPIFTFNQNLSLNDQKKQFLFWGYGMEALKSLDGHAIYYAESDYDYFSTLYLQNVEHKRPDVDLKAASFLTELDWKNLLTRLSPDNDNPPRPIYFAFPNGTFMTDYLQRSGSPFFKPSGTVIELNPSESIQKREKLQPLEELWELDLAPECRHPNPINGLLLELCAHPYLNMANYMKLKNDFSHWDSYYLRALSLIPDPEWRAKEWSNKAEGDLKSGSLQLAVQDYVASSQEYFLSGRVGESRDNLQKALELDPRNPGLHQLITGFNQALK